eukprot:3237132-Lingulodinium_polyedra.AAC.1
MDNNPQVSFLDTCWAAKRSVSRKRHSSTLPTSLSCLGCCVTPSNAQQLRSTPATYGCITSGQPFAMLGMP